MSPCRARHKVGAQFGSCSLEAQLVRNLPAMWVQFPRLGRSPGEGNSYPLQHSGLENSVDCTVHGVAKNQTRLSDFFTSSTCCINFRGFIYVGTETGDFLSPALNGENSAVLADLRGLLGSSGMSSVADAGMLQQAACCPATPFTSFILCF